MLGTIGKELAERALAGRDDQKVETSDQRGNVAFLDTAVFDRAAAAHEILHQQRQIDAVVHRPARLREIAAKAQRCGKLK